MSHIVFYKGAGPNLQLEVHIPIQRLHIPAALGIRQDSINVASTIEPDKEIRSYL